MDFLARGMADEAKKKALENAAKLAESVKKVNGATPDVNGNVTIEVPEVDTSTLATKTEVTAKADKTYVDTKFATVNASPKGVYSTLAALQTAFPTGNSNNYLVTGNIKEVDTLNVTAAPTTSGNVTVTLNGVATNIAVTAGVKEVASLTVSAVPTTAGNITVTLNGVATTVAVDPTTDTTTDLVATKIRNTVYPNGVVTGGTGPTVTFTAATVGIKTDATYSAGSTGTTGTMSTTTQGVDADTATSVATKIRGTAFTGWTTGGTGTTVTFNATVEGTKTPPTYSAGTTGTTGTMSVTTAGVNADGKWYYYDGAAWTAGGMYQGISVADSSVTYSKLDFLSTSRINLLDKTKITAGYLNSNGTVNTGIAAQLTDYIPVEYGKTYSTQAVGAGNWGSAVYDANKVFVRKFDVNKTITITDANAKFIRLVYYPAKTLDYDLMFVEGTIYPDEYIPYQINVEILDNDFKRLLTSQSFKEEFVNLMDKTNYYADGGISTTTGAEISIPGKRSWFLPIEYGKIYVGNFWNYQYGACYDANKTYLCSIVDGITVSNDKPQFYLKRSDIAFIRVSFNASLTPIPFVGEGTVIPITIVKNEKKVKFISSYKQSIKNDLDVNRPLSNLKWNVLGDSITAAPDKTRNYHSILSGQENMIVSNYGVSGSRIAAGTGATAGTEMSTRYANMDNDADIVTCFGGINDMNNSLPLGVMADRVNTTFYGALHVLLIGLHKKYIGKRIGFISPINYGNTAHEPYQQAIREVCKYYSIPLLDLSKDGMINTVIAETNTAYFADGLHPNEAGHDVIARKVRRFLLTL